MKLWCVCVWLFLKPLSNWEYERFAQPDAGTTWPPPLSAVILLPCAPPSTPHFTPISSSFFLHHLHHPPLSFLPSIFLLFSFQLFLFIKTLLFWVWRNNQLSSVCHSCKGPGFTSQHPHPSQFTTAVPGDPKPSLLSRQTQSTHRYVQAKCSYT